MSASFLISYGILWLLVLVIGYLLLQRGNVSAANSLGPPETSGLEIGTPFPFSLLLPPDVPAVDGKLTLVIISAAGCAPCKPLLELLPDWRKQYPDVPVLVLMVGRPDQVAEVEQELKSPLRFYPATVEQMKAIQTTSAPFVYVVSPLGRVVSKGYAGTVPHLRALVRQALPEVS